MLNRQRLYYGRVSMGCHIVTRFFTSKFLTSFDTIEYLTLNA